MNTFKNNFGEINFEKLLLEFSPFKNYYYGLTVLTVTNGETIYRRI